MCYLDSYYLERVYTCKNASKATERKTISSRGLFYFLDVHCCSNLSTKEFVEAHLQEV